MVATDNSNNISVGTSFIWIAAIAIITLIILIFIGVEFSRGLDDYPELIIFWLLYSITIFTIMNIIISSYFYFALKDKKGPVGQRGDTGDIGKEGEAGLCALDCRNNICREKITKDIIDQINREAGNPDPPIKLNNIYIKQRIKQMCNSKEYNEYSPYRGPNDLIKYLSDTWRTWVSNIYKAGGRQYFESVGAENEWKWVKDNPFNEIKKYDIFYWGMGKGYRPEIHSKCNDIPKTTLKPGEQEGYPDLRLPESNQGRGIIQHQQIDKKYSIQTYLNLIPEGYLIHSLTNTKFYIKALDDNKANVYDIKRYNPVSKKYDLCVSLNKGRFTDIQCNAIDNTQYWSVQFTGNKDHEVRVQSASGESSDEGKYLNIQQNPLDANGGASLLFSVIDSSIVTNTIDNDNNGTLFIMSDS
jgi:hypothetical protein